MLTDVDFVIRNSRGAQKMFDKVMNTRCVRYEGAGRRSMRGRVEDPGAERRCRFRCFEVLDTQVPTRRDARWRYSCPGQGVEPGSVWCCEGRVLKVVGVGCSWWRDAGFAEHMVLVPALFDSGKGNKVWEWQFAVALAE